MKQHPELQHHGPKYGEHEKPVTKEERQRLTDFYGIDLVEKAEKIKAERRSKIKEHRL